MDIHLYLRKKGKFTFNEKNADYRVLFNKLIQKHELN